jgi:hypothetical protein
MLGTVLTRLRVKVTSAISNAMILILRTPSILIGVLTTLKTRYAHLRLLLALTEPSTNRLHANLITVAQLIKQGLITVRVKATVLGQQLVITVRQMLQRVRQCLLQSKDRLVGLIKSEPLLSKGIGLVQTHMAPRLTLIGTKLQGIANQLLQRVKSLVKVKR